MSHLTKLWARLMPTSEIVLLRLDAHATRHERREQVSVRGQRRRRWSPKPTPSSSELEVADPLGARDAGILAVCWDSTVFVWTVLFAHSIAGSQVI